MKYIFVIPTLNRAKVLPWSVQSVLNQEGDFRIEIIISNNQSDDNTKEIALGFNDSRIKYIEADSRLSMSKHWEFASKFIDYDESVVCYLGDDDILSSDALSVVHALFESKDIDAVSRTTGYYYTPDCNSDFAGWLILPPIDGSIQIKNSINVLSGVALGKTHYGKLPLLYHGFVRGKLLSRILTKGPLFNKASPDIYSDIALACLNINYAHVNYPLTLGVASPKSNGLNTQLGTGIGEEFYRSSNEELFHRYSIKSVDLNILDSIEDLFDKHDIRLKIGYRKFYSRAISALEKNNLNEVLPSLMAISQKGKNAVLVDYYLSRFLGNLKKTSKKILSMWSGYPVFWRGNFLSNENTFSYKNNVSSEYGISTPQECLEFIKKHVSIDDAIR